MKQVKYLTSICLRTSDITDKMAHHYAILQIIRQHAHQDAICIVKRINPIYQVLLAQLVVIPRAKTGLRRIKHIALSTLERLLKK